MFCQKCGNRIPDGAIVCNSCGAPVRTSGAGAQDGMYSDVGAGAGSGAQGGSDVKRQNVYGETAPEYSGQSTDWSAQSQYSYTGYQTQDQTTGYGYGAPVSTMDGGAVGFAITSLVLGIVALLFVCCVSIWWITVLASLAGIVFGAVALGKHMGGRGMALAGIICSAAALLIELLFILLGVGLLAAIFSMC